MSKFWDFTEDRDFIRWIFSPDAEVEQMWQDYLIRHPEQKGMVAKIRFLLLHLRTRDQDLTVQERQELWFRILDRIHLQERRRIRRHRLAGLSKYAAVALVFFTVGALLFRHETRPDPLAAMRNMALLPADSLTRVIRYDGSNIPVESKKSQVVLTPDGKMVVNQDTLQFDHPETNNKDQLSLTSAIIVPHGKTSRMTLPDGTQVWLNAGTHFFFPEKFDGDKREVILEGEAFFDVRPDEEHPFIVRTGDLQIRVLGTMFNVSAYSSDPCVETVLTEGSVQIRHNRKHFLEKPVLLYPNEMASYTRSTGESRVTRVDPEDHILWKEGILKFNQMELNRIMKKLERYYNVSFLFRNPLSESIRVNGKLEMNEDFDEVLARIERVSNLKINRLTESMYEITE